MNIFQEIKNQVTTKMVAEHYGLKINRNGFCKCIFHNDRTPSLKVDKNFYCFGCNAGGDVIKFVQLTNHCTPIEAAHIIIDEMHLAIPNEKTKAPPMHLGQQEWVREKLIEASFQAWERNTLNLLYDRWREIEKLKKQTAPRNPEDEFSDSFIFACREEIYIRQYIDILTYGTREDKEELLLIKGNDFEKMKNTKMEEITNDR